MCGIVGLIKLSERVESEEIISMREAMVHRGPDDGGVWISSDKSIGLGHRRLSIIDLSQLGHQPMCNEDGLLWLVYNGEIYNFQELRANLVKCGHIFKSRTDSEVILHAYEEWGTACLDRFNGIFAFALWDDKSKVLFAARDHLGVKPFYYWEGQRGTFAFASELKALISAPEFEKKIDMESLWLYLSLRRVPAPRAIFQNCACLAPGHFLTWDKSSQRLAIKCYWDPTKFAQMPALDVKNDESVEQLDALLCESVRMQLVSDVPVGALLSGGIDSSLMVAMMARASANVRTFTIGFKDQVDEVPYAREVSRIFGTRHLEMYVSSREMLEFVPQIPGVFDEPLADSSAIPTYFVSRLAQQHVTVCLSGDGGDEMFGGYGWYNSINQWRHIMQMPRRLRGLFLRISNLLPWGKIQKGINLLGSDNLPQLIMNFNGCWRPIELLQLMPEMNMVSDHRLMQIEGSRGLPFKSRLMLHDLRTYLPDELLTKVDRASMAVSLETRVPILDHRIVEFVLQLPLKMKIDGSNHKAILKKVLYRYLPHELVDRTKRGFGAPLDEWLRSDLRWMINEYLSPTHIKRQGLFDGKIVKSAIEHFLRGQSSHYRVWALIVFQMWAEHNKVA